MSEDQLNENDVMEEQNVRVDDENKHENESNVQPMSESGQVKYESDVPLWNGAGQPNYGYNNQPMSGAGQTNYGYNNQPINGAGQPNYGYSNQSMNGAGQPNYGYGNMSMNGSDDSWKQQYINPQAQKKATDGYGYGIAAMILGILSLVLFCTCINVPLAVLAIVFAIVQMVKGGKKGLAIAGLITGIISIVCFVVFWIFLIIGSGEVEYNYSFPHNFEQGIENGEDIMNDLFEHTGSDTI